MAEDDQEAVQSSNILLDGADDAMDEDEDEELFQADDDEEEEDKDEAPDPNVSSLVHTNDHHLL